MSETSVATVPAGEAPVSDFNKVTWAEPAAAPVADVEAPAPVIEAPPEPVDPDFNFVTLENGDVEARLSTGEVYKGKNEREVMTKIAKGKVEASRHIQTLNQRPAPAIDPNKTPVDQSSQVLLDLLAPSLGAKDGASLAQTLQDQQQVIAEYRMQQTAAQFFNEVPDFPKTQANTDKFGQTLDEFNLPFTVANAKLVHGYLKANGLYQAVPLRAADGTFAPRVNTMPAPPNGNSPSPSAPMTEADIWKMTPDQFQEYRANMANH